jgi:hypothetical protein
MTTLQITDRLMASGCLGEQDRGNVTTLVCRVRRRWASKSLPIADWWDVDQLLGTLLSHLAPRILLNTFSGDTYAVSRSIASW